jgi:hypothetical protein
MIPSFVNRRFPKQLRSKYARLRFLSDPNSHISHDPTQGNARHCATAPLP